MVMKTTITVLSCGECGQVNITHKSCLHIILLCKIILTYDRNINSDNNS